MSAGYHGYWITDFTQIDPHLGTNAELEALIADAHARGIDVYFDIITNHTADVIDYAEGRYDYVSQATSPYTDAAGTAFDPATYAGGNTFPTMDAATSFPYTPVVDAQDADVKVPAWLNDPTLYHNRGNSTYSGESTTYGDFSGLDDLMTENPAVVDGFVDVYDQWVDLGVDGFRIDTAKHVNFEFWQKFTTAVREHAESVGNDDFFLFGEVYDADPVKLAPYLRDSDMNAVLDFTFQSAASNYAKGFSSGGLAALYAGDDRYTTPTTNAQALPTFLGNHDMGRIGYFVKDADHREQRSELAHSLMYLTAGSPSCTTATSRGSSAPVGTRTPGSRCSPPRWTSTRTRTCSTAHPRARWTGTTPAPRCTTTSPGWPSCAAPTQPCGRVHRSSGTRPRGSTRSAASTRPRRSSTSSRRTTAPPRPRSPSTP